VGCTFSKDPPGETQTHGKSGNTTGAHLYFQVTDGDSALAAEGILFIFDKLQDFEENRHPDLPRSRNLPMDDSVVAFP